MKNRVAMAKLTDRPQFRHSCKVGGQKFDSISASTGSRLVTRYCLDTRLYETLQATEFGYRGDISTFNRVAALFRVFRVCQSSLTLPSRRLIDM